MCGIAGLFDLTGARPIPPERLARMLARLAHRGPDGENAYRAPGIALGHRRLAIIDPAGGQQPLFNETGDVAVVGNGEIYNFPDLADALRRRGHRFRSRSDCETLVHAWEEWGEATLERLTGMFAFALWDERRRTLFLARDRLGEKPLYHTTTADGWFLFASELPALVAALPATPDLDLQAVEDYLAFGYVPDPKSIFAGIAKLPPGHCLTLTGGPAKAPRPSRPRPYWDVRFDVTDDGRSEDDLAADLGQRLRACVRRRLVADVPLGAFLSGGVDSSAIVAFMAEGAGPPVRTCSIGFSDSRFDESRWSAQVARRFASDHVAEVVDIDACALIDPVAAACGEPFADVSALPTYRLAEVARRHVTVALSGDGGDEVFAGYDHYPSHRRQERAKRLMPAALRRPVFTLLARSYPKLDWAPRWLRGKATFEALAEDAVGGYFRSVALLPTPLRRRLQSADLKAGLAGYEAVEVLRVHAERAGIDDPVARAQYLDLKTGLAGGMLTKVDRASMAHGLEVRAPFLDHDLVEWAAALPTRCKLGAGGGKRLLKKALERHLPHDLLYRPKQGFGVPIAAWARHGGMAARLEDLTGRSALADSGLIEARALRRLVAHHRAGRADHGRALWALLMLDAFLRQTWRMPLATPLATTEDRRWMVPSSSSR